MRTCYLHFMRRRFLPYNKKLKGLSRKLRRESTKAEVLLWNELKAGQLKGYIFNRQKPLLNYIVDFYCKPLNLVVEIDGITHDDKEAFEADTKRQKELEELGLHFIRFSNEDVINDMPNVLRVIANFVILHE